MDRKVLLVACSKNFKPSGFFTQKFLFYKNTLRFVKVRRPDGSVGMALVLPALTDCRWWFESLLVHSGVSSATRQKATGADHKKLRFVKVDFSFIFEHPWFLLESL